MISVSVCLSVCPLACRRKTTTIFSGSARNLAYSILIPYRWSCGVSERRTSPLARAHRAPIGRHNGSSAVGAMDRALESGDVMAETAHGRTIAKLGIGTSVVNVLVMQTL